MLVRVINPAGQMSLAGVGADASVPVGQPVVAVINTQGISINAKDLDATAKGLYLAGSSQTHASHATQGACA